MPLHIIYIPGLGDTNPVAQRRAIALWRLLGVHAELLQMRWDDSELWQTKFDRILARIDTLRSQGATVGLVGASAGASAVINAYAARPRDIAGCVLIAGKVNYPEAIGSRYRHRNTGFVTAAYDCADALQTLGRAERARIQSRYGLIDAIVPRRDSVIVGADNRTVPSIGHVLTIASQLVFGAPGIVRFLRRQGSKPEHNYNYDNR